MKDPRLSADFFENVYAVVRLVPSGRATSYGAIARYLGIGSSARTVGWAMNASHAVSPLVPAHRVVNRLGMLSGKAHFHPPEAMQQRLLEEGIEVKNDQIQNWNRVFWDPAQELSV
jgi:methylated-DNA-protein-cysteine methyltransferase-like protein